ncbi:hypothetical protein HU200_055908 [Digitaria exilis]|uniref:DNA polymerase delta subunit 3 n=1 Tax=Digitaria exilis TaxID=1010633 RepID=A0A835AJ11_9POAL|nr:hypothetical protein HU200_055908 [Digitaria exilis]
MAGGAVDQSLLDLLPRIHALFSDPLRVISYKWLSRNFSISSNDAKRLLQEFVSKNGADLQVIYSLSGWLKNNPQNYCVKLTSGPKLEGNAWISIILVYSIQASIPKDTAVLWNPEFVQAEELFNQPFDEENCLRDNRFCGVLNSFVKRTSSGKHVSSLPPKPTNSTAAATMSKPSPKLGAGNKSEKDNSMVVDKAAPVVKGPSIAVDASKNKAQNGKALPSNSGSLANMWGRASAKPKPPTFPNSTAIASVAATADAQICAKEEADADSSDDEQGIKYKRGSSNANNRKRRALLDFSDDEEDDNIQIKKNLENKDDIPNNVKDCSRGLDSELTSECKTKSVNTTNHSGITLKEKSSDPPVNKNEQNSTAEPASTSPKRRKVLKTRIDERGREVTEVVWEGEASDKTEKNVTATAASRAPPPSKPQPAANTDKRPAPSKAAGNKKPAKAGAKQGSIMSFFKKV